MNPTEVLGHISSHPFLDPWRRIAAKTQWSVVGGTVRDAILERPCRDLDLSVGNGGEELSRQLADQSGGRFVALGSRRFASFRVVGGAEHGGYYADIWDRQGGSLADDLARRDLTINALAVDFRTRRIEDPFGGLADLKNKVLRMTGAHTFGADPLRVLRLARFRVILDRFSIDADTKVTARFQAHGLVRIAAERIQSELKATFTGVPSMLAFSILADVGASPVLSELTRGAWHSPEILSVCQKLDRLTERFLRSPVAGDRMILATVALLVVSNRFRLGGLDRVGRSMVDSRLFKKRVIQAAVELTNATLPEGPGSERIFLHRWKSRWQLALISAATRADLGERRAIELGDRLRVLAGAEPGLLLSLPPLLTGHDVCELLGVEQGPTVGRALDIIEFAQVDGELRTRNQAARFLLDRKTELLGH